MVQLCRKILSKLLASNLGVVFYHNLSVCYKYHWTHLTILATRLLHLKGHMLIKAILVGGMKKKREEIHAGIGETQNHSCAAPEGEDWGI